MTQVQLFQLQAERIIAILKNDIPAIQTVAKQYTQSLEKGGLPAVMVTVDNAPTYRNLSATSWNVDVDFNIRVYLAQLGENDFATQVSVLSYADSIANALISRQKLQLNDSGLDYCKDTTFSFSQGFNQPLRYPVIGGQLYAGIQAQLRVHSFVTIDPSS